MSDQEKHIARVKALLAKAESTAFTEEQDAFIGKAQELMSKHSITAAMIAEAKGTDEGRSGFGRF